jgi:hypothetical protein
MMLLMVFLLMVLVMGGAGYGVVDGGNGGLVAGGDGW